MAVGRLCIWQLKMVRPNIKFSTYFLNWKNKKIEFIEYLGHIRIMKLLITNGGDYNSSIDIGWLPIHTSTINSNFHTFYLCLKRKQNENWKLINFSSDRDQVIGLLYRVGADINAKTPYGHTPLHFAAHMGNQTI